MSAFVQTAKFRLNGITLKSIKGSVEPQLLHEKQASSFLNVSSGLLQKWRANGDGPEWVKYEGSVVRYPVSGLIDFVERSKRKFTDQSEPSER